jgi:hypothetical protein
LAGPLATQSSIAGLEETEGSSAPAVALDGYRAPLVGRSTPPVNSVPMNFTRRRISISSKHQRDVALKEHVAIIHFKCFKGILQVFYTNVTKVDRDVAFVGMVYTRMLQAFVPNVSSIFRHMFQVYLSGCCICSTYMLQVFYLDVINILLCVSSVFR